MVPALSRRNHLAIAAIFVAAVAAVTLKVAHYSDARRPQEGLTRAGLGIVQRLVDKGYALVSEEVILSNDDSRWYRLRLWTCEVHAAPLDLPGATISAFQTTAPSDWTMEFVYRGQRYDRYPATYVTIRDLFARVRRGFMLRDPQDGLAVALLWSPECKDRSLAVSS